MVQDPKAFLMQHGEKIALGVVVLVAGIVVQSSSTSEARRLNDKIATARDQISTKVAVGVQRPQATSASLVPKPTAPTIVGMPDARVWAYYRKPPVVVEVPPELAPLVAPNLEPDCLRAAATHARIDLTWDRPRARALDPLDGVERGTCTLLGLVLVRSRTGNADRPLLRYLDSGATSLADFQLEPATRYAYQLRAYWEHRREGAASATPQIHPCDRVVAHVLEGGPHQGRTVWITEWSTAVTAITPVDTDVAFTSRAGTIATIAVWKFWRGDWWRVALPVEIGDAIGRPVSPQELVADPYNREKLVSTVAFKDMLALQKADPNAFAARTVAWTSGYVYFGFGRGPRAEEHVVLEHHDVPMRGANGLDWGTRVVKLSMSKGDTPPK